jgi:hypothetical protein
MVDILVVGIAEFFTVVAYDCKSMDREWAQQSRDGTEWRVPEHLGCCATGPDVQKLRIFVYQLSVLCVVQ